MARGAPPGPTPEAVVRELRKPAGKLAPAYYVWGPETLRADAVADAVRARTLTGSPDGLNLDVVSGETATGGRIADLGRSFPMMAPHRLVVVQDADKLGEDDQEALLAYLENPPPDTVLLFRARLGDLRTRLLKRIGELGGLVRCDELTPRELPGWVVDEAAHHGIGLAAGVAELVVEVVGGDLGALRGALEKLSLYVAPRTDVESADVDEALAHTRSHEAFDLAAAILARDLVRALAILQRILDAGKSGEEIPLLGMVSWQVRQLLRGRDLLAAGMAPDEIAATLRVFGEKRGLFLRQVRTSRGKDLLRAHQALCDADRAIKGGSRRPSRAVLEALVVRLCARGQAVRAS
jgi:DNA polymerase-3 subunit delta